MTNYEVKILINFTLHRIINVIVGFSAIYLIVTTLLNFLPIERDDSDGSWPNRSGLSVYTDQLTGCQYLGANGGLTPRISSTGIHQLGCRHVQ